MNKKFSTLMASLLLAGGLFSTASAVTIDEAVKSEQYYYMVRSSQYFDSNWSVVAVAGNPIYLVQDGDVARMAQNPNKADAFLWKVTTSTDANGVTVYEFTNKAGKKLTYTNGLSSQTAFYAKQNEIADGQRNGDAAQIMLDENGASQIQMTWAGLTADNNNVTFASYSTSSEADSKYTLAFDFVEPEGTEYTAADLNKVLGANVGFKMTVGYLNSSNKFTAYTDLEGNPFDGLLYAEASGNGYKLRKGGKDGDIIVLLNENYNKQNTDVEGKDGFKFTTMTPDEFDYQVKRDAEQATAKKVINSYVFKISKKYGSDDLEVAVGENFDKELIVSKFGTQTVLTTAASNNDGEASYNTTTNQTYVRLGSNNLVDMTEFAAKVYYTFINEDGEVAGANCSTNKTAITDYLSKYTQENMPEGQWVLTSFNDLNATFANRESKQTFTIALNSFYNTDEAGVYEISGVKYTIKTIAMADADKGYADFGNTTLKQYTIGVYSPVWGGVANFVENHASETHQIGLNTEDATAWTLIPNAAAATYNKYSDKLEQETDSVYVINEYTWYDASKKDYFKDKDTLKIVSYKIQNASNGEYIAYANSADKKFYTCDAVKAQAFAFKKVGDSYNMVEVVLHNGTTGALINGGKVYGGDSANKGLLNKVSCIYDRVENDLVKVEQSDINLYRRIQNGMDTISIYRAENAAQLLFEKETFLSWANDYQFDFAPAMLADTAYVEEGAIRPQYMLVVGKPISITKGTQELCPICGLPECEHSSATYDTVEGRYLVNLKDSAIAFDANNIHAVNPYMNTEKYYRLGFVPAKRVNKTLTITSTGKQLNIGTPDYNEAKFAFKYVDEAAGTFKIETADFAREDNGSVKRGDMLSTPGYLKTMNGVIVVVSDEANADIFNMNENESSNPTANETIAAGNVVVAGTNGAVVVKGAEGKSVIVSTILGKVVANEVLTSDNAQIAAPAGVVVVSVDGESFKVVVK